MAPTCSPLSSDFTLSSRACMSNIPAVDRLAGTTPPSALLKLMFRYIRLPNAPLGGRASVPLRHRQPQPDKSTVFASTQPQATCKSGAGPGSCIIKPCTGAYKAFSRRDVAGCGPPEEVLADVENTEVAR